MFQFGEKRPVLFQLLLTAAAFFAAAVIAVMGGIAGLDTDLSTSIARIITGAILLLLYRRAFAEEHPLRNIVTALPALLFAAWNLFYNLGSGAVFGGAAVIAKALITAAAPALFEEVLFRGIFIYDLRKNGRSDIQCLFTSAALFALIHITNLLGGDIAGTALQTVYAFVIGLVLAAVYLKNGSLLQVILIHFLTDLTNRIYIEPASKATVTQLVLFGLLLTAGSAYAIRLCSRERNRPLHADEA